MAKAIAVHKFHNIWKQVILCLYRVIRMSLR